MGEEKAKNKKVTRALILGALVLYVVFGGMALGYYFKNFYISPASISEAEAESSEEYTEKAPAPTKAVVPTQAPKEPYDTDEGNAGAARDLDIE